MTRPRTADIPPLPRPPTGGDAPAESAAPTEAPAESVAFARGTAPALEQIARTPEDHAADLRELEGRLGRCVATIAMHVQPIVHAATRVRFGYEALLRTSDRALPHPGAVLDAAERLEKVTALGRVVRAHVAGVIAAAPPERGAVFVNLHLHDLLDKQLTSPFAPLTKVARRVVLEITERTSLAGHADLRYRVAELRELGFRIAIDDFGGGHARMSTFTPLDTDFVKLDMALVRDLDRHVLKQQLVRSMVELCHDHGARVVGEGVETEAEARTLTELGCDMLQGYLIARPALPFADPL